MCIYDLPIGARLFKGMSGIIQLLLNITKTNNTHDKDNNNDTPTNNHDNTNINTTDDTCNTNVDNHDNNCLRFPPTRLVWYTQFAF